MGKLVDSVSPTLVHNDLQPVVQVTADAASPIQSLQKNERIKIEGERLKLLSLLFGVTARSADTKVGEVGENHRTQLL